MSKEQIINNYHSSVNSNTLLVLKEESILFIISVNRFFTFSGGLIFLRTGFLHSITSGVTLIAIIAILFLILLKLFSEHLVFLLDEILKGTNSADKSKRSGLFIERLLKIGGTGFIATHDTSLGNLEHDYHIPINNKCFEIEIDDENIRFD